MFRPEIDWKEDGIDYRKTGYLPLIEDATALLRALTEWVAELSRKEAVRCARGMKTGYSRGAVLIK